MNHQQGHWNDFNKTESSHWRISLFSNCCIGKEVEWERGGFGSEYEGATGISSSEWLNRMIRHIFWIISETWKNPTLIFVAIRTSGLIQLFIACIGILIIICMFFMFWIRMSVGRGNCLTMRILYVFLSEGSSVCRIGIKASYYIIDIRIRI